jgi:hypothetical protein
MTIRSCVVGLSVLPWTESILADAWKQTEIKITSYSKDFSERNLPVFVDIRVVITNTDMTQLGRY